MTMTPLKAFNDNYIWTIVSETNHTMLCVDPGDASPVIEYCKNNQLKLKQVLITHHHYDHAGGLQDLINEFPEIEIYGPHDPRIPLINHIVRDEDIIHIGEYDFRVISIPGHTSTHICFYEPQKKWLFSGDTLFSAGCGRVFDGTMSSLFNSLQTLKTLPDKTLIFCGHEYTRKNLEFAQLVDKDNETIKKYVNHLAETNEQCTLPSKMLLERQINPFLRTDVQEIIDYVSEQGHNVEEELDVFQFLRNAKDQF